ncbi:MAG TPA: radical SAM protein [Fimbriimonadaceae bacterium]|nr:radical SAM protein [Fimbriimonadaceae bacterium]
MSTIQTSLFELSQISVPPKVGRAFVRSIEASSILTATKGKGKIGDFDYSLNPYRGCGFGCSYCYAAFFVPEDIQRDAWGEWVEVKENAVALLTKQKDLGGKKVLMSSATDPYQPVEAACGLTRSIMEHLVNRPDQPDLVIQTRSPLVTRDIDLFRQFRSVRVNMTVSTDSDAIRKKFEPGCASIERRLQALRDLKEAGISIGVSIAPMLPIEDPIGFARTLKALAADRYWTVYFHSSDRKFASNTGKKAIDYAREMGWTEARFRRTKELLKHLVPGF